MGTKDIKYLKETHSLAFMYLWLDVYAEDYTLLSAGISLITFPLSWASFFRATPPAQVELLFDVTGLKRRAHDSVDLRVKGKLKKQLGCGIKDSCGLCSFWVLCESASLFYLTDLFYNRKCIINTVANSFLWENKMSKDCKAVFNNNTFALMSLITTKVY